MLIFVQQNKGEMAVGKYTNAEDRREAISVIVRTILGIITTFLLLSWFSGGFPFHLSADMFLSRSFLTAFLCFWAVFAVGYLLFSRVELWKILLTGFCLGIAVPILRAALFFVFLSFHAGFLCTAECRRWIFLIWKYSALCAYLIW